MSRKVNYAARASRRDSCTSEQQRQGKTQRRVLATAVASCLMLGAPIAFGQSAGSNLRGQVTSESGPAAETEVVATNLATGAVRRTRTSTDGSYVLVGLPPGTYSVEAGGNTATITLSVASNATLNLEPGAGDVEQVVVTGARPAAADVRT